MKSESKAERHVLCISNVFQQANAEAFVTVDPSMAPLVCLGFQFIHVWTACRIDSSVPIITAFKNYPKILTINFERRSLINVAGEGHMELGR